jgi:hypothetical protein
MNTLDTCRFWDAFQNTTAVLTAIDDDAINAKLRKDKIVMRRHNYFSSRNRRNRSLNTAHSERYDNYYDGGDGAAKFRTLRQDGKTNPLDILHDETMRDFAAEEWDDHQEWLAEQDEFFARDVQDGWAWRGYKDYFKDSYWPPQLRYLRDYDKYGEDYENSLTGEELRKMNGDDSTLFVTRDGVDFPTGMFSPQSDESEVYHPIYARPERSYNGCENCDDNEYFDSAQKSISFHQFGGYRDTGAPPYHGKGGCIEQAPYAGHSAQHI